MVVKAQKIGREIWGRDVGSETAVESSKNFFDALSSCWCPLILTQKRSQQMSDFSTDLVPQPGAERWPVSTFLV